MMDRQTCLKWIRAGLAAGQAEFARRLAADWLAHWPGDFEVQLLLARTDLSAGRVGAAGARLEPLIRAHPSLAEAYELLVDVYREQQDGVQSAVHEACARALRRDPNTGEAGPAWAGRLAHALELLDRDELAQALQEAEHALRAEVDLPLPLWVAVQVRWSQGEFAAAAGMARAGLNRWPECVPLRIIAAQEALKGSTSGRAVESLHRAAAGDPTGGIVATLLGADHAYRALWPEIMTAPVERPLPAAVSAFLGENRLPEPAAAEPSPTSASPGPKERMPARGAPATEPDPSAELGFDSPDPDALPGAPVPETWEAFRGPDPGDGEDEGSGEPLEVALQDLGEIAARWRARNRRKDEDGRSPAYVLLSSRTRLWQVFGGDKALRIEQAAGALLAAVHRRPGWNAYRIYIDDPADLEPFGLAPADPGNPWQIKLRLGDLDRSLAARGEMVGALLILGGPKVVPFHMLPNPTEDIDTYVPSDNPYTATDENYFAPEWPVGRLPVDEDADALVKMLRQAAEHHLDMAEPIGPVLRVRLWLGRHVRQLLRIQPPSLGYSASLWRKASMSVFRSIGEPRGLMTSPPVDAANLPPVVFRPVRLSYFNLHGVEDGPEWFGQKDPLRDEAAQQDFPVALRPDDIVNGGRAPKVVFTEACYGANVVDKSAETAICLKFLQSGSHVVVGSTKISYGSITPPLLAADLLGHLFWEQLNQNLPAGEALRRAKLELAAAMHRRQGYLDGEDQKALISFVLYGDPLYLPRYEPYTPGKKAVLRRTTRPARMQTACALGGPDIDPQDLDPVRREVVTSIVARYLPGMKGAQCHIHTQQAGCDGEGHACPTHQLGVKSINHPAKGTVVVTLSKQVTSGSLSHQHFARLTIDGEGKVLKLAVSR